MNRTWRVSVSPKIIREKKLKTILEIRSIYVLPAKVNKNTQKQNKSKKFLRDGWKQDIEKMSY
jgi:hypothetical protein